jgi:HEAT repeat protein
MSPRTYFALSLLVIFACLSDQLPVTAQKTYRLPMDVPAIPRGQESVKPIVVSELVEQLRTANVEARRKIIQQLSDTEQNIVPTLVKALDDPDPLVKSGVAEVLGNLTDAAVPAVPGLIEMMKNEQRALVPEPPSTLSYPYPSLMLPPLPSFLAPRTTRARRVPPNAPQNPENLLRITAIAALGKIGLPARTLATPPLIEALQDPDPWVRLNATWALAEVGASSPLLSYWLEALQNSNPDLRRSAAAVFQDSSSLLRKVFGAEATASTTEPLLTALKDEDFTVREAADDGLALLGVKALPGLVQALKAPEAIVRLKAAKLLGNLESVAQPAVPGLVALLNDPARYEPPKSNTFLFPPLPSLPFPIFSGTSLLPPDNPEQLVRASAAIALGEIGDRNAVSPLTTALKDTNPWMQLAASWALLKMDQTQGLPVVGRLVKSPNSSVRRAALSQLAGYGPQATAYLLPYYTAQLDSPNDNERNSAIIQLGKFGPDALNQVPKLRSLLVSNLKHSPGYAATILGELARDTAAAWQNGNLPAAQRQQAIAEFTQVLSIMQSPNARFNREPRDRIYNALITLRGIRP